MPTGEHAGPVNRLMGVEVFITEQDGHAVKRGAINERGLHAGIPLPTISDLAQVRTVPENRIELAP